MTERLEHRPGIEIQVQMPEWTEEQWAQLRDASSEIGAAMAEACKRLGDSARKAVMLDPGCMKFSLFASEGAWLHGGWYMPEVTDADAVARAISEALAWIREQE